MPNCIYFYAIIITAIDRSIDGSLDWMCHSHAIVVVNGWYTTAFKRKLNPLYFRRNKILNYLTGRIMCALSQNVDFLYLEVNPMKVAPKNSRVNSLYSRICLVWRLSNRKILLKVGITGQFCFFSVGPTGQLKNLGRLTLLVICKMSLSNRIILSYFWENFIFKIVLLDRFDCTQISTGKSNQDLK